ncbi:reverse transcriptase domain-containing protein [Heliorestis acidaminivorans]|uniref:reverse transcriptase domain-containing protein n=1 Tax=Heliorestis acidaminivorans TaxID=553427 RepID=UPI00242FADDD|nr:reverse transcriptase domain-containing protein [Heliorestis acidaminivorans]
MYYALDLWFYKSIRPKCKGNAFMIRYADDHVACFKYKQEAEDYYKELKERLKKFNLELAEEKTKILPFGMRAYEEYRSTRKGKPSTFDFLGFTHYCSRSRKGKFRVKRKTSKKKFQASIKRVKEWIRNNRILPIKEIMDILRRKLNGYYQYYGITDNAAMNYKFHYEVRYLLFKWLNRRSQRLSFTWPRFTEMMKRWRIPEPCIHVNIFRLREDICYYL